MKFLRASLLVSSLLLLGRFSGFAREWYLGWRYGAGLNSDLAILILTFPDLLVNITLGGGMAAALIPEFRKLSSEHAKGLLLQVCLVIAVVFVALAAAVALFPEALMRLLAPGLPQQALADGRLYFSLAAFVIPLIALNGVLAAWLNAEERFQYGAAGTTIFNICVISAMVLMWNVEPYHAVTFGILAGGVLRLLASSAATFHSFNGYSLNHQVHFRRIFHSFTATFVFTSVLALIPAIARAYASHDSVGALSIFSYATKVIELPITVAIGAVSIVLMPRLAEEFHQDQDRAATSAALSLRAVTLISLALAIPAVFFSDTLFRVIFFNSNFTIEQLAVLRITFAAGMLFLPIRSILIICGVIFPARGTPQPLMWAAIVMLVAFLLLLNFNTLTTGLVGIMVDFSISIMVAAIYLSVVLLRYFGRGFFKCWFDDGFRCILLPTLLSVSICALGWRFGQGTLSDVAFGLISLLPFAVFSGFLNKRARVYG